MRFHTTRLLSAGLALCASFAICSLTEALAEEASKPQLEVGGMTIDDPSVKAEVEAVFQTYEAAIVRNDVATLEALFRDDPRTIRYGAAENLYGMDAIRAFRRGRSPVGLARDLKETVITTYGTNFATAMTLFTRSSAPGKIGRQSQTWVRFPDGWRVVAAHVSLIDG
jgi:hypothetical protein